MKAQITRETFQARFIPHDGFTREMTSADKLAELVSNGMTIGEAALRLGLSYDGARRIWRKQVAA